jgi:glutamate synthase domain-containing protein 3
MQIDARGVHYRDLNRMLKEAAAAGEKEFVLDNVNGQRYIGTGVNLPVNIVINGVPGNDLAAFMDGPAVTVCANAQDGVANTMNAGTVVVHGSAGDVLGYGMRGGKLYIRNNVGYRVGIHMKEYKRQVPVIIAGGTAGDFFGEYMAGGVLILLGLERRQGEPLTGDYLGTGMHGGVIYLRGPVEPYKLGKEVAVLELDDGDEKILGKYLKEYCDCFGLDYQAVREEPFVKLLPVSSRPYGRLYVY